MEAEFQAQQQYLDVFQRANQIARHTDLEVLLDETLLLLLSLTHARVGSMYLYDPAVDELAFSRSCHTSTAAYLNSGQPAPPPPDYLADDAVFRTLLATAQPVVLRETAGGLPNGGSHEQPAAAANAVVTTCWLLHSGETPVGGVQLSSMPANLASSAELIRLVQLVLDRLATEIDKASAIARYKQQVLRAERSQKRLNALVSFITQITTTLERNQLIQRIMNYAEELLEVEATSFWLLNSQGDRLELLVAGGDFRETVGPVSIAADKGIIGHVVTKTGKREIVNDVSTHPQFHRDVDLKSGFVTRSILCVPMLAPTIERTALRRGKIHEHIIGGAQALNKRDGSDFTEEDAQLFESLTRQAAIAFQFSQLFEEDDTLFWGIVKAISTAADLKDPSYSQGHSRRVSHLAVEIATELGCNSKEIAHIRIGSRLHDLGKIGISDMILGKQGRLDSDEMAMIKQHPTIGYDLLHGAGLGDLLREELRAVVEHHERLDGNGYPNGLKAEDISLTGRIVAVADVFDALTNDRPYRNALTVEEAFRVLNRMAGKEVDTRCVEALWKAWQAGRVELPA